MSNGSTVYLIYSETYESFWLWYSDRKCLFFICTREFREEVDFFIESSSIEGPAVSFAYKGGGLPAIKLNFLMIVVYRMDKGHSKISRVK